MVSCNGDLTKAVLIEAVLNDASIIQGSVIGPNAYVINASDLKTFDTDNSLDKYADDTYLIVPASKSHTIMAELDHVSRVGNHK